MIHGINVIKETKETISWAGYHVSRAFNSSKCHHCNSTTLYGERRFTFFGTKTFLSINPTLTNCGWAFGTGKDFRIFSINQKLSDLGEEFSKALPVTHAFSGCDTASSFTRKGKKSVWKNVKAYTEVLKRVIYIAENPFSVTILCTSHFETVERFIVVLCDKSSIHDSLNCLHREHFCKLNRALQNLPQPQDAFRQHFKWGYG